MINRRRRFICCALCSLFISPCLSGCLTAFLDVRKSRGLLPWRQTAVTGRAEGVGRWHAFSLSFQRWSYTTHHSFSSASKPFSKAQWEQVHTINNHHPPDFTQYTEAKRLIQPNGLRYKVSERKISTIKKRRSPWCSNETPVCEKKHALCKCASAKLLNQRETTHICRCWCQGTCQGFFFLCNTSVLQFGQRLVALLQSARALLLWVCKTNNKKKKHLKASDRIQLIKTQCWGYV